MLSVSSWFRCPTGEARITPGFDLPAKFVIHTVGPVYHNEKRSRPLLESAFRSVRRAEVLDRQLGGSVSRPDQVMLWPVCTRAHRSSLELAGEHNLSSVAFPAISCGVYGYPIRDAAQVAVKACLDFSNQVWQDSNSAWFTYLHLSCVREAPYTFDRLADP